MFILCLAERVSMVLAAAASLPPPPPPPAHNMQIPCKTCAGKCQPREYFLLPQFHLSY